MTGNNKVWRAPVAGLASAAMLATMGVAAMTANAASGNTTPYQSDYTVSVPGQAALTVFPGETYADAYARQNGGALPTLAYGAYTVNGEAFDPYRTPITSDMKVSHTAPAGESDSVTVVFGGDSATYETLPFGSEFNVTKNTTLGAAAVPVDKADGAIVETWNVQFSDKETAQTVKTADLANLDVEDPANGGVITITPNDPVKASKITFDGDTLNEAVMHVAGSYTDGVADEVLTVDTTAAIAAPGAVVSNAVTSYEKLTGWENEHVTTNVGENIAAASATYTPKTQKTHRVYFLDGSKLLQMIEVADGQFVKAEDVKTPSKDGYFFAGWYADASFMNKVALLANGKYDFAAGAYKITSSWTFYAKFNENSTVNVTFSAGTYDGAPADVTIKYDSDEFVKESDAPEFTRDGYVLTGWTLNGVDFNFDAHVAGDVMDIVDPSAQGQDFTLYAKWAPVNADVAAAALKYVEVNNENKAMFTAGSWSEYAEAYKAAEQKYESAQYRGEITPAISSEIVSDLKAAWEKLVFKHTTNADVSGYTTVHRLSMGAEHFYTQDPQELSVLTSTETTRGGWTDEGRLFQTAAPDKAAKFASFDRTSADDQIVAQLDEAADPIVTTVYRAYNKANGDHVWTVDENEYAYLESQADWNAEGAAFYAPTFTGTTNVVRLYKNNRHLLSTDSNEQKVLSTQQGWTNEGTAFLGY